MELAPSSKNKSDKSPESKNQADPDDSSAMEGSNGGKPDQWLVRTAANEIRGPFAREAILQQIRDGLLQHADEVCRANHYWFYLDERDEVSRQLGVEMPPKPRLDDEEVTDTQTQTLTQDVTSLAKPGSSTDDVDLPELLEVGGENTAVLSNRALREFQGRKVPVSPQPTRSAPPRPMVVGGVERPSLWRWLVIFLVLTTILSVGLVVFLLQRGSRF